ncbi:hypothetical protein IKE_03062 [Bacillus cereus VD196]|uniref:Uncharacterized protein n=1 Tax=Bacillus cereus VD196 TaxID=1053243 RepID=A0A9W5V8K7_BACCE|nr:hypothetical protein [Bacillus cereus]EOO66504.1 hypothetical protein IKE_03062 [Bacillus cereus VD196]
MNGVFVATRIMKGHEVRKKCAESKNSPTQMFVEDMRRKRQLEEMNRKVSDRREVS